MASEASRAGLTGGCQCGAVRYRIDATPRGGILCHCRMCQKAGGAPFMAFVGSPNDKFALTRGKIAYFASSDIADRGFCRDCGTPLTYRGRGADHVSVTIGSLDDPDAVTPNRQLGAEARVHWLDDALRAPATSVQAWFEARNVASIDNRQHPDRDN